MNVYDFDKTIYVDDCAADFYKFTMKKHPILLRFFPKLVVDFIRYKQQKITRTEFKETLYRYVTKLDNLEELVQEFWLKHEHKIKQWYLDQKKEDDLIISASPEFLIFPICQQLSIAAIASRLNPKTGHYQGLNCYGDEKVVRFYEAYPDGKIDQFYSDSLSDTPLARLAQQAYLVIGDKRIAWPQAELESDQGWD